MTHSAFSLCSCQLALLHTNTKTGGLLLGRNNTTGLADTGQLIKAYFTESRILRCLVRSAHLTPGMPLSSREDPVGDSSGETVVPKRIYIYKDAEIGRESINVLAKLSFCGVHV